VEGLAFIDGFEDCARMVDARVCRVYRRMEVWRATSVRPPPPAAPLPSS